MAGFFNDWFSPAIPIEPSEIMATNGVSGLLNTLAFNICDAGEGIIVPVPNYAMLELDFCAFTGVEFITLDTSNLEEVFEASILPSKKRWIYINCHISKQTLDFSYGLT
jgi:histidinol-phosphate/aromatic aminotransferase/cobyric acid decarboxylase-like protein